MNPRPLVKALMYLWAAQRLGPAAYRMGLWMHPRHGLVLQ
jgi:hypothetical protein